MAEEEGSATNSSRVIMWHWKAADGPGESRATSRSSPSCISPSGARSTPRTAAPSPIPSLKLTWNYTRPHNPDPAEVLKEINGYALEDLPDPADPSRTLLRAGQLLPTFGVMRADGKTAGGMWIYTGVFTEAGNMSMRRDAADPTGLGYPSQLGASPGRPTAASLYKRASADPDGKPWSERKKYIWVERQPLDRRRRARLRADHRTGQGGRPVHHEPGGHRPAVRPRRPMPDGPFPEHYEPMDAYIANPLHPKVSTNPVVRVFAADAKSFGTPDKFPIVATSYRLAEHFHYWTKNVHDNAVLQPELFVEMGERLAKAQGNPER